MIMRTQSQGSASRTKPLLPFFLLVVLFSIPFWVAGALAEHYFPENES
jgi:hypothetical protein